MEADSVDFTRGFWGSRYGKGGDDYFNCTMTEEEYRTFYEELLKAEKVIPTQKGKQRGDIALFGGISNKRGSSGLYLV